MPIQVTCPQCQKTLRVSDALMGKKVRCPGCQAAVPVGGAVKAARPPSGVASAVKQPARPTVEPDEDDAPRTIRKNTSALPIVAIVVGAALLLFLGGSAVVGFFIWRAWTATNDTMKQAGNTLNNLSKQEAPPSEPPKSAGDDTPKPPDPPKPPDRPKPPDNPKPVDKPRPPDAPAAPTVIQAAAPIIPMPTDPKDYVQTVFFPQAASGQAVVVGRGTDTKTHLDRYDLTTGAVIETTAIAMDQRIDWRDLSPDGAFYFSNAGGNSTFSVWHLPNPKPVMEKWTVPSSNISAPGGVETTIIAAYILDGRRFVTVNGGAQVWLWSIPDKKQLHVYAPPASVAKYAGGLWPGATTAISPDRKKLAVFNGVDGFFVVDTGSCQLLTELKSPDDAVPVPKATFAPAGAAFSPDGSQFAALLHWQRPGGKPVSPSLVRWDVSSQQIKARFPDPSGLGSGPFPSIGWWGQDYCWVYAQERDGPSGLVSWEKQARVLKSPEKAGDRAFPGSPDGRYWFLTTGTENRITTLRGLDLPADALKQAGPDPGQLLTLTPEAIVKK